MEIYLLLFQLGQGRDALKDGNKIIFASTIFKGTAAVWSFALVKIHQIPTSFDEFKKGFHGCLYSFRPYAYTQGYVL